MKLLRAIPALCLLLALAATIAACGQVAGASPAGASFSADPAAQTVAVRVAPGGHLAWEQAEYEATAGDVTFIVSSPAGLAHNFAVDGQGLHVESKTFAGGTTNQFTLRGLQPGTYQIICTVPGHRAAGMVATLRVR